MGENRIVETFNFNSQEEALNYINNNDFIIMVKMIPTQEGNNSYAYADIYNTKTKQTTRRKIGGSKYIDRCFFQYENEKYYMGSSYNKGNKYVLI